MMPILAGFLSNPTAPSIHAGLHMTFRETPAPASLEIEANIGIDPDPIWGTDIYICRGIVEQDEYSSHH